MKKHIFYWVALMAVFVACNKDTEPELPYMSFSKGVTNYNWVEIMLAGSGTAIIDWGDGMAGVSHTLLPFSDSEKNLYRYRYSSNNSRTIKITGENMTHLVFKDYNSLKHLEVGNNSKLTYLDCSYRKITNLDVSNNTALTYLNCSGNELTNLDVSNNTKLENLNCERNHLTSLNVDNNTALKNLDCSGNELTKLNLNNNTRLDVLYCIKNQLTTLNLSNNVALTYLVCWNNRLTSLNVDNNTALTYLNCFDNQLTSLYTNNNTALSEIECGDNQITSLGVSNNTALTYLGCRQNDLSSDELNRFFGTLHDNNGEYKRINISENPGTDTCDQSIASSKGWSVYTYRYTYGY